MTTDDRYFITGAFGCLGAWTVKQLLEEGHTVFTFDLPGKPHRLEQLLTADQLAQVNVLEGDVTDAFGVEKALGDNHITHVCHLAALQVPLVKASPVLGAKVNVVGTNVLFEAARKLRGQIQGFVYCSSVAVYGHPDLYPPGPMTEASPAAPTTLYGVHKVANEQTAAIYWADFEVPSIGLRPSVIYGIGRDQGWTSQPTKAIVAACQGESFHLDYGGVCFYQYAPDAARCLLQAANQKVAGAPVFNMGGTSSHMNEVVAAIESALPEMSGRITFDDVQIALPRVIDYQALDDAIGSTTWTPITEGIHETIKMLQ